MKKILKQDVIKRTLDSLIARSYAEIVFTLPDGLYYWGLYQGMTRVLKMMFDEKELGDMLKDVKLFDHPWTSRSAMEDMLTQARIELAESGMRAQRVMKDFQFGGRYDKQKAVNMITDLLKNWSPPQGGDKL